MKWIQTPAGRIKEKGSGPAIWGYLDKNGQLVIEASYESALPFAGGLAAVRQNGEWGLIDPLGAPVTGFRFDRIYLR